MSEEGKNSQRPLRLSVVEVGKARNAGDSDTDTVADGDAVAAEIEPQPFEGAPQAAANDCQPQDAGRPSPVHDLVQALASPSLATPSLASASLAGAIEAEPTAAPPGTAPAAETTAPPSAQRMERIRVLEAVIFASREPVDEVRLTTYVKPDEDLGSLLAELQGLYRGRGVNLVKVAGKWAFRTAEDLSWALERHSKQERRLSKAALETLAIVAYHQPVTRAEIEEVRGVSISKGTLDVLMEIGWVRPRGRRRAPGKPITYGTTERFLEHFGLDQIRDLPGIADLKAQGLLDANLPPDFKVPEPTDVAALMPDELPLEAGGDGDEPLQTELELEPLEDAEAAENGAEDAEEGKGGG